MIRASSLLLGLLLLNCCSCVFNRASQDRGDAPQVDDTSKGSADLNPILNQFLEGAQIRKKWQKTLLSEVVKNKAQESYLLVTYGGYSDHGQFAIYTFEDARAEYHFAKPNTENGLEKQEFSEKRFEEFLGQIKGFEKLSDYRKTSFDGSEFEFLYIRKEGESYATKRIFINSLGLHKGDEQHRKLVKAFLDLKKKK